MRNSAMDGTQSPSQVQTAVQPAPRPALEPIKLVLFIVNRGDSRVIDDICTEEGIFGHLLMHGRGTVDNKTASLLGLDEREKDIVLVTVAASKRDYIMDKATERLRLNKPGRGIALSIPFSSVASQFDSYSALAGLTAETGGSADA